MRLLKLPLDLLRLTWGLLVLTEWVVARSAARLIGVEGPSSGPFCLSRRRSVDAAGEPCTVCLYSQRYANLFVFRCLCRWVSVEQLAAGGCASVCRRSRRYTPPFMRYVFVVAAVAACWVGVWFGAVRWLAVR